MKTYLLYKWKFSIFKAIYFHLRKYMAFVIDNTIMTKTSAWSCPRRVNLKPF